MTRDVPAELKTLTNAADDILNIYINKAVTAIQNYLNVDDTVDIQNIYPDAIEEYVVECLNRRGNEGTKQFTQGGRQGTYEFGLNDDVKALLPVPFVHMMG